MADALYYETRLLCPLNGTVGGTTIAQVAAAWMSSPGTFVVSGSAGHQITDAQAKWGGTSLRMNGGLQSAGAVTFNINNSANSTLRDRSAGWTVEAWVRFDSVTTRVQPVFGGIANNGTATFGVWLDTAGKLNYTENAQLLITEATASVVANTWTHIAVSRGNDGVVRLFRDGVLLSPTYTGTVHGDFHFLYLGSMGNTSTNNLAGYLQDFRLTSSVGRYMASFTPPAAAFDTGTLALSYKLSEPRTLLCVVPGVFVPAVRQLVEPRIKLFDVYWGGRGRISGTTKVKGTPNYAVSRLVRLHRESDGMVVRAAWSDPVTGAYSFDYIDATQRYTVITYDYQHNFRAVVADNLTPDLMP